MKKVFIIGIVIMVLLTVLLLGTASALFTMDEDGFAVPSDNVIYKNLKNSSDSDVSLVGISYDDVIYSSRLGYYAGENRTKIDTDYPMFVNGGAALRFLDESNWLIGSDVVLRQTYDGLYLNDGYTYNSDRTRADSDEFILLALSNGLYINAMGGSFENRLGTMQLPINSIMCITKDSLSWYEFTGAGLNYVKAESVFDAKITIGEHTYTYADLVEALGLVQEAIENAGKGNITDEAPLQQAAEILEESEEKIIEHRKAAAESAEAGKDGAGSSKDGENDPVTGTTGKEESKGEAPATESEGEPNKNDGKEGTDNAKNPNADSGDSKPGDSNGETGGQTPEGNDEHNGESGNGQEQNDPGTGDTPPQGDNMPGDSDTPDHSEGSGDEKETGTELSDDETDIEDKETGEDDSEDAETGDKPAGDGQSEPGEGSGEDGNDKPGQSNPGQEGESGSEGSGSHTVKYTDPVVSMDNFQLWSYAVCGDVEINDPSYAILRGVTVTVYGSVKQSNSAKKYTDENGYTIYPAYTEGSDDTVTAYLGKKTLLRKTVNNSQPLQLSILPPDTTVYVQLSYRYTSEPLPVQVEERVYDANGKPVLDSEGNFVTETVTKLVSQRLVKYTDIIELKTEELSSIPAVSLRWDEVFASSDSGFCFDSMKLENLQDYDETAGYSFENFCKNMLPYVSRVEITMKPLKGGKEQMTSTNANILNSIKSTGADYSGNIKLESNSAYSYTVIARDKYGNEIPVAFPESKNALENGRNGIVYTAKKIPSVTVTEVENETGKLTLAVKVADPDSALVKGEDGNALPLIFRVYDGNTDMQLYGEWSDGTRFGSTETLALELDNPSDGKEYTFTLESLAFAKLYTINVFGSYDPQPSTEIDEGAAERVAGGRIRLDIQDNITVASAKVYTAALTNGSVFFTDTMEDISDTSARISFTMNANKTTIGGLPLVDEFVFSVIDANGKTAGSAALRKTELSELMPGDYTYDPETHSVTVSAPGDEVKIQIQGDESMFAGQDLWSAILASTSEGPNGKTVYNTPAAVIVSFPEGSFKSSSIYTVSAASHVIKSGSTYDIPTVLSVTSFTTRKIQPKLIKDELFIAGDMISFFNVRVFDPDETILDGRVIVKLYYNTVSGSTLISTETLDTVTRESTQGTDISFDGLINGGSYSLVFYVERYKDTEDYSGFKTGYKWQTYNITAGSGLYGNVEIAAVNYSSVLDAAHVWLPLTDKYGNAVPISGAVAAQGIDESADIADANAKWTVKNNQVTTPKWTVPKDATAIRINNYLPPYTGTTYLYIYFYQQNGAKYTQLGYRSAYVNYGITSLARIPAGTTHINFVIPNEAYLRENGLSLSYYTTELKDLFESTEGCFFEKKTLTTSGEALGTLTDNASYNAMYMLPVKQGQLYMSDYIYPNQAAQGYLHSHSYNCNAVFYNSDKVPCCVYTTYIDTPIVVPNGCCYMSLYAPVPGTSRFQLYLIADTDDAGGYRANVRVNVEDNGNYLYNIMSDSDKAAGKSPEVYMDVSVNGNLRETFTLSMVQRQDGIWIYDEDVVLTGLPENSSVSTRLYCKYMGRSINLDTMNFSTDGAYTVIRNNEEMLQIARNPYGNFIVARDFTHHISLSTTFYGTIDFQGHVITRDPEKQNIYLISTIQSSGTVKNLVYEFPADFHNGSTGIFQYNYGLMDNIIIRTAGDINIDSTGSGYLFLMYNYGTVRNLIMRIGGGFYINQSPSYGGNSVYSVLCYSCRGIIENMYVYGAPGAGIASVKTTPTYSLYSALIYSAEYSSLIRNMFVALDGWSTVPTTSGEYAGVCVCSVNSDIYNGYYVGDSYTIASNGIRNRNTPVENDRTFISGSVTRVSNFYHITDNTYKANYTNTAGRFTTLGMAQLNDTAWQSSVLGGNFSVENNVNLGYYPRLNLNTCMQKHQEFIPLPVLDPSDAPEIVGDGWADKLMSKTTDEAGNPIYTRKDDTGHIVIQFKNDRECPITDIQIEGLVTDIVSQGLEENGLYNVVLSATVAGGTTRAYVSNYNLKSFTYASGNKDVEVMCSYTTSGFDFWKTIRDLQDWYDMDGYTEPDTKIKYTAAVVHKWNYHLAADLDFTNVAGGKIMVNGNDTTSGTGSGAYFYGKLDGGIYDSKGKLTGIHTLRNIEINDLGTSSGIFYIVNGATIKNLAVEKMSLTVADGITPSYCGFIGYSTGSVIDNVHINNSSLKGCCYLGALVGHANTCDILNCSVTSTSISDLKRTNTLYSGGLVGYLYVSNCYSSYTRNIKLNVTQSPSVEAVGGLAGESYYSNFIDCYADGSVTALCNYVGGIFGRSYNNDTNTVVNHCWTNINMDVTGESIFGIAPGYARVNGNFAAGTILSSGQAYRTQLMSERYHSKNYAYSGQIVNELTAEEADSATKLFNGDQLSMQTTWSEEMGFSNWMLSTVEDGYYPKVYRRDGGGLVWGQDINIDLPGQEGEHSLLVTEASAVERERAGDNETVFTVIAELTHPGYTLVKEQEELPGGKKLDIFYLEKGGVRYRLNISIDGMITDDYSRTTEDPIRNDGSTLASISVDPIGNPEDCASRIFVTSTEFSKATDSYRLFVQYVEKADRSFKYDLQSIFDYGVDVAWEVPDYGTWLTLMPLHGDTFENFKITGIIDFGDLNPDGTASEDCGSRQEYRNLCIGNLYADLNADGSLSGAGFYNMSYNGGTGGESWIDSLSGTISGITFENIDIHLEDSTVTRARSGLILVCSGVDHCLFSHIDMTVCTNTAADCGFFATLPNKAPFSYCELSHMTLSYGVEKVNNKSYAGVLAGSISGFDHLNAHDITVNMPNQSYVCGIAGHQVTDYTPKKFNSFSNINVYGRNVVSGIMYSYNSYFQYAEIDGIHVEAATSSAGGIAYSANAYNYYLNASNIEVKTNASACNDYTGGLFAYYGNNLKGITLSNIYVEGRGAVGGLASCMYSGTNITVDNVTVVNSAPSSDFANESAGILFGYSGGTLQYVSITNSSVHGLRNVGAITGLSNAAVLKNIYVGNDVYVTADANSAGGLIGASRNITVTDCISGATVRAYRYGAGGFLGSYIPASAASDKLLVSMKQSIYSGKVFAGLDYAGGIVGYAENNCHIFTPSEVSGLMVAADVSSGGANASIWISSSDNLAGAGDIGISIWENSTANGRLVADLMAADTDTKINDRAVPLSGELLTADAFREAATYSSKRSAEGSGTADALGGFSTVWSFDNLSSGYMPAVQLSVDASEKYDMNWYHGATDLPYHNSLQTWRTQAIPLPPLGNNTAATAVYAVDADKINIEVCLEEGEENRRIYVNNREYISDEYGVVTLRYDFKTTLRIKLSPAADATETVYEPNELRRTVMVCKFNWYYIDSGAVKYGSGMDKTAKTLSGPVNPVNLWQGKILCDNGEIYQLSESQGNPPTAIGCDSLGDSNLYRMDYSVPVISYNYSYAGSFSTVKVFHNFSLITGSDTVKNSTRLFILDGNGKNFYPVSAAQGVVYDGVILSYNQVTLNQFNYFFTVLGTDGKLRDNMTEILGKAEAKGFRNENIKHISNSFTAGIPVVLAVYRDGTIAGYNYVLDELLFDTSPEVQSAGFASFAVNKLQSLFSGSRVSRSSNAALYAEAYGLSLNDDGSVTDGPGADVSGKADSYGINDLNGAAPAAGTADEAGSGNGLYISGDSAAEGDVDSANGTGVTGDAGSSAEGSFTELPETDVEVPDSETVPLSEILSRAELKALLDSSNEAVYIEGEGLYIEGELVFKEGEASYIPGEGVYYEGELIYEDSSSAEAGSSNAAGSAPEGGASLTKPVSGTGGGSGAFGISVIYNPATGAYELYDTESLLTEKPLTLKEKQEKEAAEEQAPEFTEAEEKPGILALSEGFGKLLSGERKQGFTLVAVLTGCGVLVLLGVYFGAIRKKKNASHSDGREK